MGDGEWWWGQREVGDDEDEEEEKRMMRGAVVAEKRSRARTEPEEGTGGDVQLKLNGMMTLHGVVKIRVKVEWTRMIPVEASEPVAVGKAVRE